MCSTNNVLVKHEGIKVIAPYAYETVLKTKETGKPQTIKLWIEKRRSTDF
jgi:hypothetical protein